jgi:hypothetical protein
MNSIAEATAANNESVYPSFLIVDDINESIKTKTLYIYNISTIESTISRPPNVPRMLIRKCPQDQEYILCGSLNHPSAEQWIDNEGMKNIKYGDGIKEVARLLCPFSPTTKANIKSDADVITSQDLNIDTKLSEGDQYNKLGVFWSFNNPPFEAEVIAAKTRMEKTYKQELMRMSSLEMENPANAMAAANNVSRSAADYFNESTSWHKTSYAKAAKAAALALDVKDCPECGFTDIPTKAKMCFHCNWRFDAKKQGPSHDVEYVSDPLSAARKALAAKRAEAKKFDL